MQRPGAAFVLNQGIQEAPSRDAVHVGPLRLVGFAENDAVVVLGLDAEDAARRHDGVVDLRNAAVGAREHEVVQHVLAACSQRTANPDLAEARDEIVSDLGRGAAKNQRQEQRAADGEHEHGRTYARDARGDGRFGRERR